MNPATIVRRYRITRTLSSAECPWLNDAVIQEGATMHSFHGNTYGCISDTGMALTHNAKGEGPFVEIPEDAVELIS